MNETKFYLKSFFTNRRLKSINLLIDNNWTKTSIKIQNCKQKINKNIKRIGRSDATNLLINKNIKDIYKECQKYWTEHKTFKNKPSRQLREIFLILFPNPNEGVNKGIYDQPDQFNNFLDVLIQQNKQSYLRRLISELLYHYPQNKLLFHQLNKIYNHLDKNKKSNQCFIESNRCFHLTEKKGPAIIASNILDTNKNLDSILKDIWIKERHLLGGIGQSIALHICPLAQGSLQLEDEKMLDRILDYFTSSRYNDLKLIVATLLNPFQDQKPKNNSIQTKITKFLDQRVGDPRHKSERWMNMPEQKAIFLRWKVDETIKNFLELLTYTAKEDLDADRMWPFRKEFIECYWQEGHINDAWIILGKKDYDNRNKFLEKDFEGYGQLQEGNSAHSVLLFQIDDLTISEWNYNGKARIWKENNQHAPKFYEKIYFRDDLASYSYSDLELVHRDAEVYSWQKRLSEYIKKQTGIEPPLKLSKKIYHYH